MTAVADARLDSIPLIAITGQVPQQMIGTDAFQDCRQLVLVRLHQVGSQQVAEQERPLLEALRMGLLACAVNYGAYRVTSLDCVHNSASIKLC